jgi:integrase
LLLPIRLQTPTGDEVEPSGAAAWNLHVLLEAQLSRFEHGVQQARPRAGPGHVLGHKVIASILPKVLPINSHLRAILEARSEVRWCLYVFGGYFRRVAPEQDDGVIREHQEPTDGPLKSIKWTWAKAIEDAGLGSRVKVGRKLVFQPDVVIHDLRRTFNTVCAELGYPPQVFDTLLGHKVAGMAGVYTRLSPAGGILAEASQATADPWD